jgi:hypothetical protein
VHDVPAFLGLSAVFGGLAADGRFVSAMHAAYVSLGNGSPAAVLRALA